MKEGKLPDPKERENEIDLGQKLQLDRDKEFQRRLKEAQGEDYVEPSTASESASEGSPNKSKNKPDKKAEVAHGKKKKESSVLDYIIVASIVLAWLALFVIRHYPGMIGMQAKSPVEEKEEFTLESK